MSELKLSAQLVEKLQVLLVDHDSAAADPGVASQYLSAITGFLLGQQDVPPAKRDEILEELAAFTRHVTEDVAKQRQQTPAAAPPRQEAFGIWKPPKG